MYQDKPTKGERVIFLYEKQGGKCYYCKESIFRDGKIIPYGIDHKQPTSLGGKDVFENWALACNTCNNLKGSMPEEYFVELLSKMKDKQISPKDRNDYLKYLELKSKFER